jgi:hypothetical protein
MSRRTPSSRWALWVFAAALLLKSAMPWLASASAQMQGKPLVEVCTVYGVSLVATPGNADHAPAPDHATGHANEHCALTALAAFAGVDSPAPLLAPLPEAAALPLPPAVQAAPRDASAAWVARLKHGPPTFA